MTRKGVWETHYNNLADLLDQAVSNPKDRKLILQKVHSIINIQNGYNYAHIAVSAKETILQIIKERNYYRDTEIDSDETDEMTAIRHKDDRY
jgi:hypothetical protein